MIDNPGACETCGRNFKRWEFRLDAIGRAILEHRCDPAVVAAYQAREAIALTITEHPPKFCRRCEQQFIPTSNIQLRCAACIPFYNRELKRRLYRLRTNVA